MAAIAPMSQKDARSNAFQIAGGAFLLQDLPPEEMFIPEDFSEEQRQIAATADQFAANEIIPAAADIEAKNFAVTRSLLRKAGELGLMAVDIPEEYGGLAMNKVTSAIVADHLSPLASFSVAFSAHAGIGTLPIVWYGSPEQKERYLPRLATGEWIGAYALSEASSGSDAMNIRARATLSQDGAHYILNGEKMWITNAGFADLFTVFVKVSDAGGADGAAGKFTAFLIERNTRGLTIGPEEHKLGIRGSSTCPLVLTDCRVPMANLLGEVGKGHHIAFNILNIGRFKLGAACVGGAKSALVNGIRYAKERRAFNKPIAEFGLIQQKLADCATRIYVAESMAYRTVGMIDAALSAVSPGGEQESVVDSKAIQKRIEEYAVECSILKVWGSEMLDTVVDHIVQIYAGYGYVEEYPAERAYRDSRINRIFEGTNEINRLIITGFLLKRATSGQLPLLPAIHKLMDEVLSPPALRDRSTQEGEEDPMAPEIATLAAAKKIALFAAGAASQRYMAGLIDQQEIMSDIADIVMEVYALESALLRTRKLGSPAIPGAMTRIYAQEALVRIEPAARRVLAAAAEGDALRIQIAILRRLVKDGYGSEPPNTVELSRAVAAHILSAGRYAV